MLIIYQKSWKVEMKYQQHQRMRRQSQTILLKGKAFCLSHCILLVPQFAMLSNVWIVQNIWMWKCICQLSCYHMKSWNALVVFPFFSIVLPSCMGIHIFTLHYSNLNVSCLWLTLYYGRTGIPYGLWAKQQKCSSSVGYLCQDEFQNNLVTKWTSHDLKEP